MSMTESSEEFVEKMLDRFIDFRRALTKETDRGCALYAAAYLDRAISDLLFLSLVANKNVEKDLFEGTAPLASFSSRIKLAYYLGKLSPSMRRDLDLIRKIRNDFAHSAENLTFETEKVANRCKELQYTYHDKKQRPRGHFTAAVCGILATI
jgi:DNA-binding MltR family transcriptional regulator